MPIDSTNPGARDAYINEVRQEYGLPEEIPAEEAQRRLAEYARNEIQRRYGLSPADLGVTTERDTNRNYARFEPAYQRISSFIPQLWADSLERRLSAPDVSYYYRMSLGNSSRPDDDGAVPGCNCLSCQETRRVQRAREETRGLQEPSEAMLARLPLKKDEHVIIMAHDGRKAAQGKVKGVLVAPATTKPVLAEKLYYIVDIQGRIGYDYIQAKHLVGGTCGRCHNVLDLQTVGDGTTLCTLCGETKEAA